MKLQQLAKKLDLQSHLQALEAFYARPKPLIIDGDSTLHYELIEQLATYEFPQPPSIDSLEYSLKLLEKQAILPLETLYGFVALLRYFRLLRQVDFGAELGKFINSIEIDEEVAQIDSYFDQEGNFDESCDEELRAINRSLETNRRQAAELLRKIAHSNALSDYAVDTQIHLHAGEESLLVRGGFTQAVKARVIGRSEGGFFYIVPQEYSSLKATAQSLITKKEEILWRYAKEISSVLHQKVRYLRYVDRAFDRFDHYQARVMFARANDFVMLQKQPQKKIRLKGFAHPAIANPILLDIAIEKPITLVTGVNAGGKTMLLKSILSAVFMTKYLIPFSCNKAHSFVGSFKNIEAIIDDPQSIKHDISTFAGRMQEFSNLFSKSNAIVGVDEIEIGTDADEAASLFQVLLKELIKKENFFIVTTHHKRLASLLAKEQNVELIAALYDEQNQCATYSFLQGGIGKSYAFETAKRYGIPAEIIAKTKQLHGQDKERLNELIERSTQLEIKMTKELSAAKAMQEELERKKAHLQRLEEQLNERYKKAIATLENRYNAATKRALEALKAKESTEGRRLLTKAHQFKANRPKAPKIQEPTKLSEGQNIKYRSYRGVILSLRATDAIIEVDGMKMKVPLKDIKPIKEQKQPTPKPKNTTATHRVERSGASISIKILGLYGDEAIERVDKFISDALVNGFSEVEIIHGMGSGILAKLVREYLKAHPKIDSFYSQKGNPGVTIVVL